jgi:hypothetical protein
MAVTPIAALEKRVMTKVVNKREMGKKALMQMLFPRSLEQNLLTEYAQVDQLTGDTGMAPFVEKNGKAIAVDSLNGDSYLIETPAINIKRAITPSKQLLERQAGEGVFVDNADNTYRNAMEAQIAQDITHMDALIENRVEWMIAMLLQGQISYSVEGGASFKITTAKPGTNTFTVTDLWDGASPKPLRDMRQAKRLVQPYSAPGFTVGICGQNAAAAVYKMAEEGKITAIKTDSGIAAGLLTLIENYQENGMMYLGVLGGVPLFEYAGTYIDDSGNPQPLIRDDYVELVSTARPDMRAMFYGAIIDAEAILNGMSIGRRFATSDLDKDAGTYVGYLKSRPFPWFFRPDWNVSMKVV